MPRVYEFAREHGVSSTQVLEALAELTNAPPSSASANVPADLIDQLRTLLAGTEPADIGPMSEIRTDPATREQGKRLIHRAFEIARLSGKPDWQHMSSAVLKNRLLDLTGRTFDEADYGAESFQRWLELFSDVVAVDRSRKPPWLRLLEEAPDLPGIEPLSRPDTAGISSALPARWRIRRDLWRAIVDVGAAGEWVWDGEVGRFEPDPQTANGGQPSFLPTLEPDDLREWRADFVARAAPQTMDRTVLDRWAQDLLPDSTLPSFLRGQWVGTLKRKVLQRLRAWFAEHDIEEPPDLVQDASGQRGRNDPVEQLRGLVLRCVQEMTRAELEELRLPPMALLRSSRK